MPQRSSQYTCRSSRAISSERCSRTRSSSASVAASVSRSCSISVGRVRRVCGAGLCHALCAGHTSRAATMRHGSLAAPCARLARCSCCSARSRSSASPGQCCCRPSNRPTRTATSATRRRWRRTSGCRATRSARCSPRNSCSQSTCPTPTRRPRSCRRSRSGAAAAYERVEGSQRRSGGRRAQQRRRAEPGFDQPAALLPLRVRPISARQGRRHLRPPVRDAHLVGAAPPGHRDGHMAAGRRAVRAQPPAAARRRGRRRAPADGHVRLRLGDPGRAAVRDLEPRVLAVRAHHEARSATGGRSRVVRGRGHGDRHQGDGLRVAPRGSGRAGGGLRAPAPRAAGPAARPAGLPAAAPLAVLAGDRRRVARHGARARPAGRQPDRDRHATRHRR